MPVPDKWLIELIQMIAMDHVLKLLPTNIHDSFTKFLIVLEGTMDAHLERVGRMHIHSILSKVLTRLMAPTQLGIDVINDYLKEILVQKLF